MKYYFRIEITKEDAMHIADSFHHYAQLLLESEEDDYSLLFDSSKEYEYYQLTQFGGHFYTYPADIGDADELEVSVDKDELMYISTVIYYLADRKIDITQARDIWHDATEANLSKIIDSVVQFRDIFQAAWTVSCYTDSCISLVFLK